MAGRIRRKRLFRVALPALLVAGFAWFRLGCACREIPLIRVGGIRPAMNFSTVRVDGVLESDARRLHAGGAIYWIDDGTGTIAVFAGSPSGAGLPRAGSRVSAVGSLGVGPDGDIRLQAETVELKLLGGITTAQQGERMSVTGRVSRVRAPRTGSRAPHRILLDDGRGTLHVVHWLTNAPLLKSGDRLEVRGRVDLYEGCVELRVFEATDLRCL